jgi:superfamily II DNA/RNA helicase
MDLIERGLLNLNHVKVVCIDEADFMFDIGFQSKIDEILTSIKNKCEEFQLLCFTATLSNQIVGLTKKFMNKDKIEIKMEKDDSVPSSIEHFGINLSK